MRAGLHWSLRTRRRKRCQMCACVRACVRTQAERAHCSRAHAPTGRCKGTSRRWLLPRTRGPQQCRLCSSGTKVCEPVCTHVHLLARRGQLLRPRGDRGWMINAPKRPRGTVHFDVKWTKQSFLSKRMSTPGGLELCNTTSFPLQLSQ